MRIDPYRHLCGFGMFHQPRGGLGAGIPEHLLHHACVIDYAAKNYDRDEASDPEGLSLSFYGRRLVDCGLLMEHFNEQTGKWTVDADGPLMRDLRVVWRKSHGTECPIDAAMVVAMAYIAVMGAPDMCQLDCRNLVIGGFVDQVVRIGAISIPVDATVRKLKRMTNAARCLNASARCAYRLD